MSIKAGNGTFGGNYIGQSYHAGNPKLSETFIESFQDFISLVDEKLHSITKFFAEALEMFDGMLRIKSFLRGYVDNIAMSETFGIIKVFFQRFTDAIHMLDNWASDLDEFFALMWTEAIGVTDNWSRKLDKLIYYMDHIDLYEGFVAFKLVMRNFIDAIAMSEAFAYVRAFGLIFVDAIHLADISLKKAILIAVEHIHLIDTKLVTTIRGYIDSIHLSDLAVKSVRIVLSSVVSLTEGFVARLNGMVMEWIKTAREVASWVKRSRLIGVMNKIARKEDNWTQVSKEVGTTTKIAREESEWIKLRRVNDHE